MGDAEEPRDVRDTLTELERRLLELERELRSSAAEDAATGAGSPPGPLPPGAPLPPAPASAPGPADPAVEQLAADARERLAALRASLEGLEGASDRLRETAQTVVAVVNCVVTRMGDSRSSAARTASSG